MPFTSSRIPGPTSHKTMKKILSDTTSKCFIKSSCLGNDFTTNVNSKISSSISTSSQEIAVSWQTGNK
ncbi:unnamed protein product [Peronospora farinosa]|uniref:Uncharacterized protein n=1 Tax=Peronospora farinosa TaxID=134698 RepID=A0ABN8BWJ8_9STRA|nr:unnamed protein product [Peronospora farinosa]